MAKEFKYQITTPEFSRKTLIEDIDNLIKIFKRKNISSLKIMFGYAWAVFLNDWKEMTIDIDSLQGEIQKAEQAGHGELGDDDLYIYFDNLEIRYCHHGDIHLRYSDRDDLIDEIIESWLDKNWTLRSTDKEQEFGLER